MPPTKYDKKPEPGDLIEIFRGGYQHWVIYVGDGFVIHLAPPSEYAQAGSYSMMSVTCDRAFVKKEKLSIVAGPDKYQINNLLDEEYGPRPIEDIIKDAERLVGSILQYSLTSSNCEHFVTELRYGKPVSRQVRSAVGLALAGTGLVAGVAALAYAFSSGDKEKQTK